MTYPEGHGILRYRSLIRQNRAKMPILVAFQAPKVDLIEHMEMLLGQNGTESAPMYKTI